VNSGGVFGVSPSGQQLWEKDCADGISARSSSPRSYGGVASSSMIRNGDTQKTAARKQKTINRELPKKKIYDDNNIL
jgi:hypothetical protein